MIDYGVIDRSIEFYSSFGYSRIEAPWIVTKAICDVTKPTGSDTYTVSRDKTESVKEFVASGEQSFLYLINKGNLPASGKFQTVTPCMRNEPFDQSHMKCFVKNELISYDTNSVYIEPDVAYMMMKDALRFFSTEVQDKSLLKEVMTSPISWDIEYDGVEIGSYGVRQCDFVAWAYATGVAEPRFSRYCRRKTHEQSFWISQERNPEGGPGPTE
jgi:hypothetical protein